MFFLQEGQVIIKYYRLDKKYCKRKLLTEFPNHGWTVSSLRNLIKKIDQTGSIDHKGGSGRPRSAQTNDSIEFVKDNILSQETNPGSHSI